MTTIWFREPLPPSSFDIDYMSTTNSIFDKLKFSSFDIDYMSTTNSIFDKLFIIRHRLYVDHELDLRQAFHHSTSIICRPWTRSSTSFSSLDIVYINMSIKNSIFDKLFITRSTSFVHVENELVPTSHLDFAACTRLVFIFDVYLAPRWLPPSTSSRSMANTTSRWSPSSRTWSSFVLLYQSWTFREILPTTEFI